MFLIRASFSLLVVCSFIPTVHVALWRHYKLAETLNNADGLQGLPVNSHQEQELQHGDATNQNAQNDVLTKVSQETKSPKEEIIKMGDSSTHSSDYMCQMCFCKRPFHEDCLKFCCGSPNSNVSNINSSFANVNHEGNPTTSSVTLAMKEGYINQDHQENSKYVIVNVNLQENFENLTTSSVLLDMKAPINQEQKNVASFNMNSEGLKETNKPKNDRSHLLIESSSERHLITEFVDSEKPLPSKPTTLDSDVRNEKNHVSNCARNLFNIWTVALIILLLIS